MEISSKYKDKSLNLVYINAKLNASRQLKNVQPFVFSRKINNNPRGEMDSRWQINLETTQIEK